MKTDRLLALSANWRVVFDSDVGVEYAEILGFVHDGEWQYPDHTSLCMYCFNCMGCLGRNVFMKDPHGNVIFRNEVIRCRKSPTGLHKCPNEDDMEESDRLHDLGLEEFDQGKFAEAEAKIREAIDLHPYPDQASISLGLVLEIQGDLSGAIRAYRNALSYDPNEPAEVHLLLGTALQDRRRYPEALKHLRACIRESEEVEVKKAAREAIRAVEALRRRT